MYALVPHWSLDILDTTCHMGTPFFHDFIISQSVVSFNPPDRFQASRRMRRSDASAAWSAFVFVGVSMPLLQPRISINFLRVSESFRVSTFLQAYSAFEPEVNARILAGDFNVFHRADHTKASWKVLCDEWASRGWPAPPEKSAAVEKVLASWNDAFYHAKYRRSDSPTSTCWAIKPLFRIDYIFCDRKCTAVQRYGCFY